MDNSNQEIQPPHYYGNIVRILFLTAALVMMVGLPAIRDYLHIPTIFSVTAILVLSLAAGLTNPRQIWEAGLNAIISIVAFLFFESYAVWAYEHYSATDKFFIANLALGFIFLFATYFSVKTFRVLLMNREAYILPKPPQDNLDL